MAKKQNEQKENLNGVVRVFNYERVGSLFSLSPDMENLETLNPINALGSSQINMSTGEILTEKPNVFYPVERVGSARFEEEAGTPIITDFTSARDLKKRAMALLGTQSIAEIFNDNAKEEDDDSLMENLENPNSNEVDEFNASMVASPYYVDSETGLARYEIELAKSKEDIEGIREYMANRDNPAFREAMDIPLDDLKTLIEEYKQKQNPPVEPQGEGE